MAIKHVDPYKRQALSGDTDAIPDETSPCAIASGLDWEAARLGIQKTNVDAGR